MVVGHRGEVGDGVMLYHEAESATNGGFDHQVDVWVGNQLQRTSVTFSSSCCSVILGRLGKCKQSSP